MNKANIPVCASVLSSVLVLVLIAFQSKQHAQLESLRQEIQQQTAVVHRALGKVIPVELPEPLTKRLVALETRIGNEESWPKNAAEVDAMDSELREFLRQIPAWAEQDLLPRLNRVRWAVQSFQVLQANADAKGEAWETIVNTFSSQLQVKPDGGSMAIAAVLASSETKATARFEEFSRESSIKDAEKQLGSAVMDDGLGVWQRLSDWTNSSPQGQKVIELRQRLRSRWLVDDTVKLAETIEANLLRFGALTNDALRLAGYLRALESVTTLQLNYVEEPDMPLAAITALNKLSALVEGRIKTESDRQKKEEENRSLGYQQWALKHIADFEKYFANFSDNPNGVAAAMRLHLLPISRAYLDYAVEKLFGQAFEKGWNKLDDKSKKPLQTGVAQADAMKPKKTPQNYMEK